MFKFIPLIFALLFAAPLLADDDMTGTEGALLTNWNTQLVDEVDGGWAGTWRLRAAILRTGGKAIQFPLAGHSLTIDHFGNYTMDYKTAHMLTSSYVEAPVFVGHIDWIPPAGLMPSGVPSSCATSGVISGFAGGKMFAPSDVDLDRLADDGSAVYGLPWIEAVFDPSVAIRPKIRCPGADIDVEVKGAAAVMPIGAGRGNMAARGPVVSYDYSMSEDLTSFTMISRGNPRLIYLWVK